MTFGSFATIGSLVDTQWSLVSYDGEVASGVLSFDDTTVHSRFCNTVAQGYSFDGTTVTST